MGFSKVFEFSFGNKHGKAYKINADAFWVEKDIKSVRTKKIGEGGYDMGVACMHALLMHDNNVKRYDDCKWGVNPI